MLVRLRCGIQEVVEPVQEAVVASVQLLNLTGEAVHLLVHDGEALGNYLLQPRQLILQFVCRSRLIRLGLLLRPHNSA